MPRQPAKLSTAQVTDALQRWKAGDASIRALAEELGVGPTPLRRRLLRLQAKLATEEPRSIPEPREPTLHWTQRWAVGDGSVLLLEPFAYETEDGDRLDVPEGTAWSLDAILPLVVTARPRARDGALYYSASVQLDWFARTAPEVLDLRNRWISPSASADPTQVATWEGAEERGNRVRTGGWMRVKNAETGETTRKPCREWTILSVNASAPQVSSLAHRLRAEHGRDEDFPYPGAVPRDPPDFDPERGWKIGEWSAA